MLSSIIDNIIPFIVPFNRNLQFTGRRDQLTELHRRLFVGDQTSKIAATGLGGVGKCYEPALEPENRV